MKNKFKNTSKPPSKRKNNKYENNKSVATNFVQNYEAPKKWFEEISEDPDSTEKVSDEKLVELLDEAKKCYDSVVANYNIKMQKTNQDYQWMKTVMSKGTITDKIAAYTVLIQDDPVYNISMLQNMVNLVKVGKNKESVQVIESLCELLISDILIPTRNLRTFSSRPLAALTELTRAERQSRLVHWYFEQQLKETYGQLVSALAQIAAQGQDVAKEKAIGAMGKLLISNSEQEKNLLCHIVNKLGDPIGRISSKALYTLDCILGEHPAMVGPVFQELRRLLLRPRVSPGAQHLAVCALARFKLDHEDSDLAVELLELYTAFFKKLVHEGDVDTRTMSSLLTGVNRCYPFAKSHVSKLAEHVDTLYKVVHVAGLTVAIHTLNLLFQMVDLNKFTTDRFYTVLYKKMLDIGLGNSNYQALFLNLIFRALKKDENIPRIQAFIKRLLQIALNVPAQTTVAILFLVHHVTHKKPHMLNLQVKIEDEMITEQDEEEHFTDIQFKEGQQTKGVKMQINVQNKATKEVVPSDQTFEYYQEEVMKPPVDMSLMEVIPKEGHSSECTKEISSSSWEHGRLSIKTEYSHSPVREYVGHGGPRDPRFVGAQFAPLSELHELARHYHPTVALFATKIINKEKIVYSGDPLKDFSLLRFLERFSYKNPKKVEDMQRPALDTVFGRRQMYVPRGPHNLPVNSQQYLALKEEKVPIEERYLYRFLKQRQELQPKKESDSDDESDSDSVASDEFEALLDKMGSKHNAEEEDVDFLNEIGDSLKKSLDEDGDSNIDSSSDEGEELSGEEDVFSNEEFKSGEIHKKNKEKFEDNSEDELDEEDDFLDEDLSDESEMSFDSDDDKVQEREEKGCKKSKNFQSMFASAEDFASILEQEQDFMAGTSNAVNNQDRADKKQLSWELERQGRTHSKKRRPSRQCSNNRKKFKN